MLGQHIVMHVATLEDVGQDMAHLLAHAEEADGGAFIRSGHYILPSRRREGPGVGSPHRPLQFRRGRAHPLPPSRLREGES
ncbi:hypothetical protein TomTYG45_14300 [Sphingobium sp. TomTYG45]